MKNIAYFFIISISIVLILIYGQDILIQLIVAFILWFITFRLKKKVNKIKWFRRYVPSKIQLILILSFILFVLYSVFNAILSDVSRLTDIDYSKSIVMVSEMCNKWLKIDIMDYVDRIVEWLKIETILSQFIMGLSSLLSQSMMILIFLLFLFLETDSFKLKISAFFPKWSDRQKFMSILENIEISLSRYFRVKAIMSLITASCSFVILYFLNVDFPIFWSSLIFLLNFIPTIGSIASTLFAAIFTLLQFGSLVPFLQVLFLIGSIQQIVGNIIEPKLMGKTLNISPIVAIVSLTIWSKIWGIMGMLFSVPITVIMIIVFSQFETSKKWAILLSEKGNLSFENKEDTK